MAEVAFAVPWRSDNGGRRDMLWAFVRGWLQEHHPQWPIIASDGDPGPFNRGQAINRAAQKAGNWEVLIVCDADNIADPAMLELAVTTAAETQQVVAPYEVYVYLNEYSTDHLIASGGTATFLAPLTYGPHCCGAHDHYYNHSVLYHHCSGIQVFPRRSYERVGGFIEWTGWGYEDSVMTHALEVLGGGVTWLQGSALHLWHEHAYNKQLSNVNRYRWRRLRTERNPQRLRASLIAEGHPVPQLL
jgi:predicted glycosyltransferase involved in capsule biosynthesis